MYDITLPQNSIADYSAIAPPAKNRASQNSANPGNDCSASNLDASNFSLSNFENHLEKPKSQTPLLKFSVEKLQATIADLPSVQAERFIKRIAPTDPDHMLRIAALSAKKTPAEWWTNNVSRATYYWNAEHKRPWSRQWWLDWSGKQPALCDAKGEIKKYGWAQIFRYLQTYNRNGYGIYIQPNPCLIGDSSQSAALPGRCIFTESDGPIPADNAASTATTKVLAEQAQALAPDLVLTTFKSAHTYRISDQVYPTVGAWQVDQARFTQAAREVWGAETDESLTDANQLMRLPGFNHCRWQNGRMQFQPVQIAFDSGKTHPAASIDKALPALAAPVVQKSEGKAHDFSPFELASFAHLLTGYKKSGRKGYDTCQCSAHKGESQDSLHINQTTAQYTCHSGCEPKEIYTAALKVAIAKGYQLPARKTKEAEHWDYEENNAGVWGDIAEEFSEPIFFKDDAPDLLMLLPAKLRAKFLASETCSSPQAIALKAYAEFLSKAGHPAYVADAKELIGDAWDWESIPAKLPLWGWKGFIQNVRDHATADTKKALKGCSADIKRAVKDGKSEAIRNQADAWEMIPTGIDWLESQYFGDAILDRVRSAGDDRAVLGVFGATGTGKTFGLKAVRDYAKKSDRQFVYLTVKETLARAAGRELGLDYRLDLEGADASGYPDLAGCAASLIENARGISWESQISNRAIVVLDEVDLFLSVTAGANAGNNALELQRVLSKVLQSAQTVIILSAQLKSRHQKLTERVGWFDRSEMIGILKAATPKHITICDDTSQADSEAEEEGSDLDQSPTASLKNWLIDELADHLKEGKTALVLTGSQKPDSKLGTMLLEPFAKEVCGVSSVLRLDSQSIKDPGNTGFKIADRDYIVAMRAVQLVCASPSCQEGFSLKFGQGADDSHFGKVFCFDPGSKLPEQTIQDVGRDRHSTPTFISVAPGHTQKKFDGTTDPQEIRRQLQMIGNQKEVQLLNKAASLPQHNWGNEYLAFYCADVAQANAAIADKVYNLSRYFKAVGHTVEVLRPTPGLSAVGIPEEFYEEVAAKFHSDVARANYLDKFAAEELQKSGEITLSQWHQIQQLAFRQSMRWELPLIFNEQNQCIEQGPNEKTGLEIDAAFIRQWSRDRVAKPWQMYYYAQQNEWDVFAHDVRKNSYKAESQRSTNDDTTADFLPSDIISLKSRRLSVLRELGLIEFLNKFSIDVADSAIAQAKNNSELTQLLHKNHSELRFTKAHLKDVVAKLSVNFEESCQLLGVKSVRGDDGKVNHRQALTILRNVFQVKTFGVTNASLDGVRGVFVLVADDRAQALRKGLLKVDRIQKDDAEGDYLKEVAAEKAQNLYAESHNRLELFPVWDEHLKVEQQLFLSSIEKQSYKVDVLDAQRPAHWPPLKEYLEELRTSQAANAQVAPLKTVGFPIEADCQITPGAAADWIAFERSLIEAQSFAGLVAAKDAAPKELRQIVMSAWQADGRYSWLERKALRLQHQPA